MSWYTTIYPEDEFSIKNKEELQEEINEDKHVLDYLWERITGICVSNPSLYKVKDPLEHVMNIAKQHFDKYVEVSNKQNNEYLNLEYIESKEWNDKYSSENEDGEPFKPYLSYNHYPYEHNPEEGIEDCENAIKDVRKMITAYACASPRDILVKKINIEETAEDYEYNDAIKYLVEELDTYKEWLDTKLYDLTFSKLCTKYWDTHEVG